MSKLRESEAEFTYWAIDAAKKLGWLCCHVRTSLRREARSGELRHVTAYDRQGDNGLPDLILAKGGVFLLWELKGDGGRLEPDQVKWQRQGARLFYPRHKPIMLGILQGRLPMDAPAD